MKYLCAVHIGRQGQVETISGNIRKETQSILSELKITKRFSYLIFINMDQCFICKPKAVFSFFTHRGIPLLTRSWLVDPAALEALLGRPSRVHIVNFVAPALFAPFSMRILLNFFQK